MSHVPKRGKLRAIALKAVFALAVSFSLVCSGNSRASAELALDVGADTPLVESGAARRVVVRALVRPDIPKNGRAARAPLAVAIVLDKSGSMGADFKMENAKKGAMEALEILGERDIAMIAAYDDGARVLVTPRSAAEREDFASALSRVAPEGSTALYDGVELGAAKLQPFVKEGYTPRVILLSDGIANVGPSSTRELAALGRRFSEKEVTITTIGLGLDYNEDLMTALASESGGNAYFVKSAAALPDIFVRDMEDAVTLSARRVRVTVSCLGGASPLKVLGRAGSQRGKSVTAYIDNVYGSEKYALFELDLPPQADGTSLAAATVKLEYVDALTGKTVVKEAPIKLRFTKNSAEVMKNRRADIAAQAETARNAEIREEVVRLADEGRAAEASSLLRRRTEDLKSMAESSPSAAAPEMKMEAAELESLADEMDSNGSMSNEQRKETVNKAYRQKNQQSEDDVK
jgi:Ca-activated chloride channel family protein